MWLRHLFIPHTYHHQKSHLLRYYSFFAYGLLFLSITVCVIQINRSPGVVLGFATNITAQDIATFTNQEREKAGAGDVHLNDALSKAANDKAQDMFAKNYWAHFGPNGEKPWDFITQSGYTYSAAGENLARDFDDSSSVVTAWMNSPSHRDNLLNKSYQDVGIAVVNGTLLGHETTLIVQMFGKPFNATQLTIGSGMRDEPTLSQVAGVGDRAQSPVPSGVQTTSTKSVDTTNPPVAKPKSENPAQSIANSARQDQPTSNNFTIKPITVIKGVAYSMLLAVAVLLAVDAIIIRKRGVVRIATHSTAHIVLVVVIMISIFFIESGKIL